jgi:CheY-like chemotaxis protein
VEDEPLVRLAAATVMEEAGYTVIEASNADQAIGLLEKHPEITILFTDIEMPGSIDGMKLAACVRDRWPPVEIILTSGRVPRGEVPLPLRGVFLQKPYRSQELTDQLARMAA